MQTEQGVSDWQIGSHVPDVNETFEVWLDDDSIRKVRNVGSAMGQILRFLDCTDPLQNVYCPGSRVMAWRIADDGCVKTKIQNKGMDMKIQIVLSLRDDGAILQSVTIPPGLKMENLAIDERKELAKEFIAAAHHLLTCTPTIGE